MADKVLWEPTQRQKVFLLAGEDEVLYGGAAGGGKSDALVVDALGLSQEAIRKPHYRFVLFRKTYDELTELIDRSREVYPCVIPGAKFMEGEKVWKFPSGAKGYFRFLEQESDRFKHQGQEYQYVGWDELTLYSSDVAYRYLLTRLRSPDVSLKLYCRATANPGGVGNDWVQERFRIPDCGDGTCFSLDVEDPEGGVKTVWRRFVPARLADNPHLAQTTYRTTLLQLEGAERAALLEGRWGAIDVPGAYYEAEIARAREENRIRVIPVDPTLPVHTAWDLGVGDATAIWFFQVASSEVRLIDYYEASGEGLPHYVSVLRDRGYNYGKHIAPHDIMVRELGSGRSRFEVAQNLGISFQTAPRVGFDDGIHAVRMIFPRLWIDPEKCKAGLKALENYRKDYNQRLGEFKTGPVHNWASHGSDALRYLAVSPLTTVSAPREDRPVHRYSKPWGRRRGGSWMAN